MQFLLLLLLFKTLGNRSDKEAPLFYAHNARDIHRFFKVVTMSVSTRSTSPNPNQAVPIDWSIPDDDLDLDF